MLESGLSLVLSHTPVNIADFGGDRFASKWSDADAAVDHAKKRRYSMLDATEVFAPRAQRNLQPDADPFAALTDLLNKAKGYRITPLNTPGKEGWAQTINKLGYDVEFPHDGITSLLFNDTGFVGKGSGFRFLAKGVPTWNAEGISRFREGMASAGKETGKYEEEGFTLSSGAVKTFAQLAGESALENCSEHLGVLKMDVDYLGTIFSSGLPDNLRTISRMMSLSGNLQWFFEGYINELLGEGRFAGKLYIIFSGGDDFFSCWRMESGIRFRPSR